MINFILPNMEKYKLLLDEYINPIIDNLNKDKYKISDFAQEDCLNVHFFSEREYKNWVGFVGKNIFIPHGIADKNSRNFDNTGDFDYLIVSGEYWKQKHILQGVNHEKIIIGGYPKMDNMFKLKKNTYNKPMILWCPTHNFSTHLNLTTYPDFINYINDIPFDDFIFKISQHPANKYNLKPTKQELIDADIIISDSGSMIYEAFTMNKHVIFPDWIVKDNILRVYNNTFESQIYEEDIGMHANSIEELLEFCYNPVFDKKIKKFIDGIFQKELRGKSGKAIAEILERKDNS